ncbi:hypothetical protein [Micromonospora sp. NBC_01638]|nr:hypothetical protein OG811_25365 [Micromonospora sp. NBC_01638]
MADGKGRPADPTTQPTQPPTEPADRHPSTEPPAGRADRVEAYGLV